MTDIDAIRKLSPSDQETLDTLCDIEAYFRKEYAYEVENAGSGGSTIAAGMWKRYFMALYNLSHDLPELIAYGPRLTALQVAFDAKCEELARERGGWLETARQLEALAVKHDALRAERDAAVRERDGLLAALKEAKPLLEQFDTSLARAARRQSPSIETASYIGKGFDVARCIQKIETAIAKAEGRSNEFTKRGGLSSEGDAGKPLATEETGNDRPAAPISKPVSP